jgi:uncharacterized iron-regulated protein
MKPLMVFEFLKTAILGLTLLPLIGCSAAPPRQPLILRGFSMDLRPGDIVETATGAVLSFDSLIDHLSKYPIIYVGETHSSPEDHRCQQEILKGLYGRNPSLILAMEMFPREAQPWLDQYSQGLITEKEFLEKVDWEKNWGYSFDLYRGILHSARARRLRIIGLNAPIDVVNQIARKGLSALTPLDRSRLASDFHQDDPAHREYLRSQFDYHPQEHIKNFETFLESQAAWEETMAETLARTASTLSAWQQILVLIGKGHMVHHFGVPKLTEMRTNQPFRTVIPIPLDYPIRSLDPTLADYICITE